MKKFAHHIAVASLFLVPIFPLLVVDSYFFPFITGKAFFFRLVVEIGFAAWVVLAFADPEYRPRLNKLTVGVTVFALVTLISDLLGVNPLRSLWSNFERMEGWLVIAHLWAFYMMSTSLFHPSISGGSMGRKSWHRWLGFSTVIALIVAIYALTQLFGWTVIHQGSSRVDASLGNAAYLAVYMLLNLGFSIYLFLAIRARKATNTGFGSWYYAILTVLFAFIIYETGTRGTIIGLFCGLLLALFIYTVLGKQEPKNRRRLAGGIFLTIIVLGLLFWLNRSVSFVQNNDGLRRLSEISWSNTSNQARQYIWPMALKGALERPIYGWGQENFNYIFNANYNPKMWSQEQWFDRAHSVFLDWLTASGFVGLFAYLALYVLLLMAVWKSTLSMAEKSALTGLLAAYAIHNIFVFDNLASYVMFFAFLGFASSLSRKDSKDGDGQAGPIFVNHSVSSDAVGYIVFPVSLVVLVFVVYFFNVRPIQANVRLIAAMNSCHNQLDASLFSKALDVDVYVANQEIREQVLSCAGPILSSQQVPGQIKQNYFNLSAKVIQDQVTLTPKDARIYMIGGSFLNTIGQMDQAMTFLEQAHLLSPKKQTINFSLADDYLNAGKNEKALSLLKESYESDVNYGEARLMYVLGLVITGQETYARKLFADDPSIFQSDRLGKVYVALKQYDKAITVFKKIVANDPTNVDNRAILAKIQFTAGLPDEGAETLRSIEKDHPELKEQVEAAIKALTK